MKSKAIKATRMNRLVRLSIVAGAMLLFMISVLYVFMDPGPPDGPCGKTPCGPPQPSPRQAEAEAAPASRNENVNGEEEEEIKAIFAAMARTASSRFTSEEPSSGGGRIVEIVEVDSDGEDIPHILEQEEEVKMEEVEEVEVKVEEEVEEKVEEVKEEENTEVVEEVVVTPPPKPPVPSPPPAPAKRGRKKKLTTDEAATIVEKAMNS